MAEVCNGLDDDNNGQIDDVDVGNDGFCDCLNVGIIGLKGYAPSSNFDAFLQAQGTLVERTTLENAGDVVDAAFLSKYQILIVEYLPRALTSAETQAIHDWVATDGRGVMTMIGYNFDGNDVVPERDRANGVLHQFLLEYTGDYLYTTTPFTTVAFSSGHSLTTGITFFSYKGGVAVQVMSGGANNTVVGTVPNGANAAIAHVEGNGKVLAFGDEWLTFDSEWVSYPDVQPFWQNALTWLAPMDFCFEPQ